jgi:hypothetical protein
MMDKIWATVLVGVFMRYIIFAAAFLNTLLNTRIGFWCYVGLMFFIMIMVMLEDENGQTRIPHVYSRVPDTEDYPGHGPLH